ncbi:MAG: DNA integrity scanning diadenylate cyclase DisA [Acidimicrobiales bacterium]
MVERGSEALSEALRMVAPGTPLRDGLDRILQATRGALVVVGDGPAVLAVCTGGFLLDAEYSPQRLSELAKMDGAIILARDGSRIARANVHLTPRASIPTSETGTRHRTAERVARSIDVPVISVSEAMATIAVYRNDRKHTLQRTERLVDRAMQALATVQRFRQRFDAALSTLSTLEVEDTVSVRDVAAVLQPAEMVVRFSEEIEGQLVELGEDGRMIRLQLLELEAGLRENMALVVKDYVAGTEGDGRRPGGPDAVEASLQALHRLSAKELLDPEHLAEALGLSQGSLTLDAGLESRGYRLLHRLPRVSDAIVERIVGRFATLPRIMQASVGELEKVDGVGAAKARAVKDGLARRVEATILERYH